MDYSQFIKEIRRHLNEGAAIRDLRPTHLDERFRRWRHEVQSLVNEVTSQGIQLPGQFNSPGRSYRAMYSGANRTADAEALARDLSDTLVELEYIVQHYEKFGPPAIRQTISSENIRTLAEPKLPENVTIPWLLKNVPVKLWLGAGGLLVAVFLAGIKSSEISLVQEIVGLNKAKLSSGKTEKEQKTKTSAVDCSKLSSTDSAQKARVNFDNLSNRTVAVYWMNYDGAQKFLFNLGPKAKHLVDTFVSHSWCIRDVSNGEPVLAVTIRSAEEDVIVQ